MPAVDYSTQRSVAKFGGLPMLRRFESGSGRGSQGMRNASAGAGAEGGAARQERLGGLGLTSHG